MSKTKSRTRKSRILGTQPPGEQDGLFDVFANLVGVLTIVGALTAVLATTSTVQIRTPLVKSSEKEFVLVQVNKSGIWNLQPARDRIADMSSKRLEELKRCIDNAVNGAIECSGLISSWQMNETIGEAVLTVSMDGASIQRLPVPTESSAQLRGDNSRTRRLLKNMAREKKALFVILESDGFVSYRAIRSLAKEYGVPIGWEPWKSGSPVSFGSGGRSFNIQ